MGSNPSRSTKSPDCPVDNISEDDARKFVLLKRANRVNSRLPTEAEWELPVGQVNRPNGSLVMMVPRLVIMHGLKGMPGQITSGRAKETEPMGVV